MIGTVLSWSFGPLLHRISFPMQAGPDAAENTRSIFHAFEVGSRAGMKRASRGQMEQLEQEVEWALRPFFWEGHALGVCAEHACSRRGGTPDDTYRTEGFRFMFFTGLGFWNGVVQGTPLPRMSLDPDRWNGVGDFLPCYPLITGGMAFAQTCRWGRVDPQRLLKMPDLRGPVGERGALQGAGRALWFLHMGDMDAALAVVDQHPEWSAPLAEGLGVAITYTGMRNPQSILLNLERTPERLRREVLMGIRLCLGAFVEDDPREGDRIAGLPQPLGVLYQQGCEALAHGARDEHWDTTLLHALRAQPDLTATGACA